MAAPAFVPIAPGKIVRANGRRFKITRTLDSTNVFAVDVATKEKVVLKADQVEPDFDLEEAPKVSTPDLDDVPESEWVKARERFQIIKPLIDDPFRTEAKVKEIAASADVHFTTIYEWLKLYSESGELSSLIPRKRGRRAGIKRVEAEQEAIIDAAIKEVYLHKQRPRINTVIEHVQIACRNAKLKAPHANTIRKRIRAIPHVTALRSRGMKEKARNRYEPIQGSFPNAEYPLAVVQIDHTELDVIVVEEQTRKPMGRPWITVGIDVFSRMIAGIYISMEKPSAVAAGMCVSSAMLPKAEYLRELGVPGDWDVWGKMRKILVDNAKEFRGNMLKLGCEQYGIDLEMRPVQTPHYGGHIERYMGTTANEIRKLPGATFSSPKERKGYDSEKEAALTLRELERHMVDFIVNVYHKRLHSQINMPPSRKWKLGILGNDQQPGIGIPAPPADARKVRLDFMPFERRSVQPYGIVIDNINYYHEVLNGWINATDPEDPRAKRQFVIRRDPRDISSVFFFDPDLHQYYQIPYRNTAFPAVSLWELKSAQQQLKKEGREEINEELIFEAVERMRRRVSTAVKDTKATRRQAHRTQTIQKLAPIKPVPVVIEAVEVNEDADAFSDDDIFSQPVKPFDDLEVVG